MSGAPLAVRIRNAIAARVLGLPEPAVRLLAGPLTTDGAYRLDPQLALLLRLVALSRVPEMSDLTPSGARKLYAGGGDVFDGPPFPAARVSDHVADGQGGPIPMRLYVPYGNAYLPYALRSVLRNPRAIARLGRDLVGVPGQSSFGSRRSGAGSTPSSEAIALATSRRPQPLKESRSRGHCLQPFEAFTSVADRSRMFATW